MKIASPAKINLSLSVGPLQSDGYHLVDSFFHLISLHDILTVESAFEFSYSSSIDLGIPLESNLIYRAVKAMSEVHDKEFPKIHVDLKKNIPHGAGLGGGSSNAAAMIFALSKLWDVRPDNSANLEVAAMLGSDVALFLAPTTASIMTGRGEILKESMIPSSHTPLLIVNHKAAYSSTAAVYKEFDKNPQVTHSMEQVKNNLEQAAIAVSPHTGEALDWLRAQPQVSVAQVSGSGSACWAQFASTEDMCEVATAAAKRDYWIFECATTSKGIRIL
ncbi:MAG: 4-(cytidine 5'-diphospho)-2-C-methyl-D-erythritol kinase [Coriobacteriia bacterium]|nr:4-(cytidine 5'-diphospho)-2-C-methyl-D-erythritol kinase [Coriobacteriia bacterium]